MHETKFICFTDLEAGVLYTNPLFWLGELWHRYHTLVVHT